MGSCTPTVVKRHSAVCLTATLTLQLPMLNYTCITLKTRNMAANLKSWGFCLNKITYSLLTCPGLHIKSLHCTMDKASLLLVYTRRVFKLALELVNSPL